MLKSELINSVSEGENDRTEESETPDNEYISDFTKLQPCMYEPCVSKETMIENFPGKK